MRLLVVGKGGREHALAWKIAKSQKVEKLYATPGNAGLAEIAECVDINEGDIESLANFAEEKNVELTVVGPEEPLAKGIVDKFHQRGLKIFGPDKQGALIESSKVFARKLMEKYGIPAPDFEVFESPQEAKQYVKEKGAPIVVKADGLAAGKGSIVAKEETEALEAIEKILVDKIFGPSGNRIVIEEFLEGEEVTISALTDGERIVLLAPSQDYKRIFDGDRGPNTGGMGAYAPVRAVTGELTRQIKCEILIPTIRAMKAEGKQYRGLLYAGLILTNEGPKVLEFNCRFGDPESQVVLPLLQEDLVDLLLRVCDGNLEERSFDRPKNAAVCVVVASGGYPGPYQRGKEISGLEKLKELEGIMAFHAGTKSKEGKIFTNGGRVLGITGVAHDVQSAAQKAYQGVAEISFEKMYYRKDISRK